FPDYDIDPRLTELVAAAMSAGHNQYAPMEGLPALRERISAKLLAVYGLSVDAESEITITLGATEAIFSAVQAVIGAGDEAIAFDPAYDSYAPAVRLAGGRCVRLPLAQPGFRYDWERARASGTAWPHRHSPASCARCTSSIPSASPIRCSTPSRRISRNDPTAAASSPASSRRSAIACAVR